jgi:nitrous oxidase accessory protein
LLLLSAGVGNAKVLYVEPGDSIQAAVNNSTSGDLILVKAGEYEENIIVNVSGLNISSEAETPDGVHIQALNRNSSIFHLTADNITIKGFTLKGPDSKKPENASLSENSSDVEISNLDSASNSSNAYNFFNSSNASNISNETDFNENRPINIFDFGSDPSVSSWNGTGCPPAAICLELANNCTITKNNLFENHYGIYLRNSMSTTLSQNNLSGSGVRLDEWCSQNLLINNTFEGNSLVLGANCWNNTIFQNKLMNGEGISIACCGGDNLVSENEIINCSTGIEVFDVQAKTIFHDNRIIGCRNGIYLAFIFGSEIYNNTISNSGTGILLKEDCHDNELANNLIIACNDSGIYLLEQSTENRIYNNYFNNNVNVKFEDIEGNNTWNITKIPGENIMGGGSLGGNFWANLNGSGFSQLSNDTDSDGICDLPYEINGTDIDYLPLSRPPGLSK